MEGHLTTLRATLDSIAVLHKKANVRSPPPRPFTSAILNTHRLDVLDFIRDADVFEANLFCYPEVARPSGEAAAASSARRDPHEDPEINLGPRLPEPRAYVPPTPLRKHAREAEARGLIEFDARTLLKAAQRLLDNYHNAPRARKHIKTLLRKHTELQRTIRQLEGEVSDADARIGRVQEGGHQPVAAVAQTSEAGSRDSEREVHSLAEEIRREEMELMAIEQTMDELKEQRKKLMSSRPAPKADTAARPKPGVISSGAAPLRTPIKPQAKPATKSATVASTKTPTRKPSTPSSAVRAGTKAAPRVSASASSSKSTAKSSPGEPTTKKKSSLPAANPTHDETIRLEAPASDLADETIRLRPAPAEDAPSTSDTLPSSDELERICENIWSIFGEPLRFAAPGCESADYHETMALLRKLSVGQSASGSAGVGAADTSIASSNATQSTAATSGSTVDAHPQSAPPSITTALSARVLVILLSTPEPHVMDMDQLRQAADTWWEAEGLAAYRSSLGSGVDLDAASTTTGSNTMAGKAVYDLAAKKLLRLRFSGARRIVSFPAHFL